MPDDPRHRRAATAIPRDRDERVTKTPPPGSRTITTSSFARLDGVPSEIFETKTDPTGSELAQANHRAHKASVASQASLTETTELRREVREDLGKLDSRMSGVEGHVANLREGFGRVEGQLDTLVGLVEKQHQNQTLTLTAKLENEKAVVLDTVEGKKWWRDQVGSKVVALFTSAGIAAAITAAITKGC